ncbi:hypothetical protein HDU76_001048, partial [Blyttiomyces sp. JEL0837]
MLATILSNLDILLGCTFSAITGLILTAESQRRSSLLSAIKLGSSFDGDDQTHALQIDPASSDFDSIVKDLDGKYVCVSGIVGLDASMGQDAVAEDIVSAGNQVVKAVIVETSMVRHFARWSRMTQEWYDGTKTLVETVTSKAFSIFADVGSSMAKSPSATAQSTSQTPIAVIPELPANLMSEVELDIPTISSTFLPETTSDASVAKFAFDFLQGERTLGVEITKRGLPISSRVTVFGFLRVLQPSLSSSTSIATQQLKTQLQLVPTLSYLHSNILQPAQSHTYPFIITTKSYKELIKSANTSVRLAFLAFLITASVTTGILARCAMSYYKDYQRRQRHEKEIERKQEERKKRMLEEERKRKERKVGDSSDGGEKKGNDEEEELMAESERCLLKLNERPNYIATSQTMALWLTILVFCIAVFGLTLQSWRSYKQTAESNDLVNRNPAVISYVTGRLCEPRFEPWDKTKRWSYIAQIASYILLCYGSYLVAGGIYTVLKTTDATGVVSGIAQVMGGIATLLLWKSLLLPVRVFVDGVEVDVVEDLKKRSKTQVVGAMSHGASAAKDLKEAGEKGIGFLPRGGGAGAGGDGSGIGINGVGVHGDVHVVTHPSGNLGSVGAHVGGINSHHGITGGAGLTHHGSGDSAANLGSVGSHVGGINSHHGITGGNVLAHHGSSDSAANFGSVGTHVRGIDPHHGITGGGAVPHHGSGDSAAGARVSQDSAESAAGKIGAGAATVGQISGSHQHAQIGSQPVVGNAFTGAASRANKATTGSGFRLPTINGISLATIIVLCCIGFTAICTAIPGASSPLGILPPTNDNLDAKFGRSFTSGNIDKVGVGLGDNNGNGTISEQLSTTITSSVASNDISATGVSTIISTGVQGTTDSTVGLDVTSTAMALGPTTSAVALSNSSPAQSLVTTDGVTAIITTSRSGIAQVTSSTSVPPTNTVASPVISSNIVQVVSSSMAPPTTVAIPVTTSPIIQVISSSASSTPPTTAPAIVTSIAVPTLPSTTSSVPRITTTSQAPAITSASAIVVVTIATASTAAPGAGPTVIDFNIEALQKNCLCTPACLTAIGDKIQYDQANPIPSTSTIQTCLSSVTNSDFMKQCNAKTQ